MKILIVEDDGPLRLLIGRTLRDYGFETVGVGSGAEMQPLLDGGGFDLLVLDIMLPGTNGLDICRRVRANSAMPIIIISARGQQTDRIVGLELGADDYLSKPFGPDELVARVRAVLRRTSGAVQAPADKRRRITFDGWTVVEERRELFAPAGQEVPLSGAEYDLLLTLIGSAQRVVGREYLLEQSRKRMSGASDRSIDVLVSRLRSKLGEHGGEALIKTVRGAGYMFTPRIERQ
ncbi:response regulator transcription factor [Croceibacterium sp. TMG7-5b_MA50]|uniref:response regulator transcription factor n=1 Tax=Croceibacterium sp. TMG7-5b_MA50 TaxID=3121290 RepID=UPI003221F525